MNTSDFFNPTLLAILSAPLALWLCWLSVIVGIRVWQVRTEIFDWFDLAQKRRRLLASLLGLWLLTLFVAAQRTRSTYAWITKKWEYELYAVWYLPIGLIGVALLLWWASASTFGFRRGWVCWWASMIAGVMVSLGVYWLRC